MTLETLNTNPTERHDVIVIGAGQSGLAAAHHLARRGVDFVVLEANQRVGDQWRRRYESLRLYSPARYDALPGLPFPLAPNAFPTGAQMADYLESYAGHFDLPVRTGTTVNALRAADAGDGFVVVAGDRTYEAAQVVVAGGFFTRPHVPEFAAELDPEIRHFHAADYRTPSQLADGPVLVVGLGHSGSDLAMEAVTHGHPTTISGTGHGQLPFSVDSRAGRLAWPVMRFVAWNVLTLKPPIGRKMAAKMRDGGPPLVRYRRGELLKAGVNLVDARVTGVRDGRPLLADGRTLDVANVIWCTGFRPDYRWIQLPILGADGFPEQARGVATSVPGLYFLGVLFQFSFTSMLIVGAGRDAGYVVERIAARAAGARRPAQPAQAPTS